MRQRLHDGWRSRCGCLQQCVVDPGGVFLSHHTHLVSVKEEADSLLHDSLGPPHRMLLVFSNSLWLASEHGLCLCGRFPCRALQWVLRHPWCPLESQVCGTRLDSRARPPPPTPFPCALSLGSSCTYSPSPAVRPSSVPHSSASSRPRGPAATHVHRKTPSCVNFAWALVALQLE